MNPSVFALATILTLTNSSLALAQQAPASDPRPTSTLRTQDGRATWHSDHADELRATKLIGTKVVNTANEIIGEIHEIILDKDGKVTAIVIGVGGLLGIGEREIAVDYNSIRKSRDTNNGLVLTIDATKDSIKAAPVSPMIGCESELVMLFSRGSVPHLPSPDHRNMCDGP